MLSDACKVRRFFESRCGDARQAFSVLEAVVSTLMISGRARTTLDDRRLRALAAAETVIAALMVTRRAASDSGQRRRGAGGGRRAVVSTLVVSRRTGADLLHRCLSHRGGGSEDDEQTNQRGTHPSIPPSVATPTHHVIAQIADILTRSRRCPARSEQAIDDHIDTRNPAQRGDRASESD